MPIAKNTKRECLKLSGAEKRGMGMREKLIELIGGVQSYGVKHTYEETASSMGFRENDEVADHLIANGVMVFPCKIGDEFWTEWVGIRKVRCSMLTQKADGSLKGRFTVEKSSGASVDVDFSRKDHRKLFLTKEEAEAHFCGEREKDEC